MGDSVKVAVRVRPYNSREKTEGAELCVSMNRNTTKIWNHETNYEKEFNFDYSYWSHDGFVEDPATGILRKSSSGSPYADQQTVFNDVGVDILNNAWEGYHVCLFAYGQTGSGKSYSIVGYGANKGVIPIACEEIFNRIRSSANPLIKFDVKVSMLEIYNEQVQDLLQSPDKRVKGGLKVREHPKTGVFVDGLIQRSVGSYDEISGVLEDGNKHRTVAATQMNATSSRAHTVLTISFTQIFHEEGTGKPLSRKQSDINLVDLAGSERAGKTGATGDRLAEGSNINQSLSCLGKVITALAKKSGGGAKGEVVPYRESKLTRILQNALGGNSKTTMIAAISPATFNFEETLSTLRYADQVKAIKNKAIVNETPQEKLIRELKEENEKLKAMLEGKGPMAAGGMDEEMRREFEAQIEQLRREKEEAEKTATQRAQEEHVRVDRQSTVVRREISGPHVMNLNEDSMLSGHIRHEFQEGTSKLGRSPQNNIVINGLGIGQEHCQIQRRGAQHTLIPSLEAGSKTMVNGQVITSPYQLNHLDRIKFGSNLFFLFVDPSQPSNSELDWEYAVKESNEAEMKSMLGEREEEMRRKEEELQRKLQSEWEVKQREIDEEKKKIEIILSQKSKEDAESKRHLEEREKALIARQKEMEDELKKREHDLRDKEKERQVRARMDQMVSNALQMSNEVNERASMLGKPLRTKPEFQRVPGKDGSMGKGVDNVNIRMRLMLPGIGDTRLYWPVDKVEGRLPDMADMCQQYFDGGEIQMSYDPFSINPDELQDMMDEGGYIGQVSLITETLYVLLDIAEDPHPIYNASGNEIGKLVAGIIPSLQDENIEEAGYEEMDQIEGKQLHLKVSINQVQGLPSDCSQDVYCSYTIPVVGRDTFTTNKVSGSNAAFNYSKDHSFIVTRYNSKEFKDGHITINVFGKKPEQLRVEEMNKIRQILGSPALPVPAKKLQEESKTPAQKAKVVEEVKEPTKKVAPAQKTGQVAPSNDFEFKGTPSPVSLEGSSAVKTEPKSGNVIGTPGVVVSGQTPDDRDEKIRKMEEELKKAKESQDSKKSGCCELF